MSRAPVGELVLRSRLCAPSQQPPAKPITNPNLSRAICVSSRKNRHRSCSFSRTLSCVPAFAHRFVAAERGGGVFVPFRRTGAFLSTGGMICGRRGRDPSTRQVSPCLNTLQNLPGSSSDGELVLTATNPSVRRSMLKILVLARSRQTLGNWRMLFQEMSGSKDGCIRRLTSLLI